MINQRLYPDVTLGNGVDGQTIASHGCYEQSLNQGLNDRGFVFTPQELNTFFIRRGVFPKQSAMLSSSTIQQKCPEIFLEGRNEAWDDARLIEYMKNKSEYIILGEVNAAGIGGSGQHFVYIQDIEVKDGKISMTFIGDPWDGLDRQKVTTRYNKYGNILSLRVFKVVKGGNMGADMYTMKSGAQLDLNNKESMKVACDKWDEVVHQNIYVTRDEAAQMEKDAYARGRADQAAAQGSTTPTPPIRLDDVPSFFELKSVTIETTEGNKKIVKQFAE